MTIGSIEQDLEVIGSFSRLNIAHQRALPIRASEMGLLIFISRSEEPATALMAAKFFNVSKPMVTAMVTSLVKQGYMIREQLKADKRAFELRLTEAGELLVKETHQDYCRHLYRLREGLGTQDYNALIALLKRANTLLSASRREVQAKEAE